jgi:hypothetical protein
MWELESEIGDIKMALQTKAGREQQWLESEIWVHEWPCCCPLSQILAMQEFHFLTISSTFNIFSFEYPTESRGCNKHLSYSFIVQHPELGNLFHKTNQAKQRNWTWNNVHSIDSKCELKRTKKPMSHCNKMSQTSRPNAYDFSTRNLLYLPFTI